MHLNLTLTLDEFLSLFTKFGALAHSQEDAVVVYDVPAIPFEQAAVADVANEASDDEEEEEDSGNTSCENSDDDDWEAEDDDIPGPS